MYVCVCVCVCVCVSPLPLEPSSYPLILLPRGCHRMLGWAPCVVQQLPTSFLFDRWWYMYAKASLLVCPPAVSTEHPLHLCFCSCHADRFISIIFLDSVYMHWRDVFFFSWLNFTLYDQVNPPHFNRLKFVPFYGWVIFHCLYVPQRLYPFICQ